MIFFRELKSEFEEQSSKKKYEIRYKFLMSNFHEIRILLPLKIITISCSLFIIQQIFQRKIFISDFFRFAKIQRSMTFQDIFESFKYVTDS